MVRIRRFGVIRTANLAAVLYLIATLVFIIPFALILATTQLRVTDSFGQTTTFQLSPLVLLIFPILYAVGGWIITALMCLLYNLAARLTGGIEVQVERPAAPAMPQPAPPPVATT